MKRPVQTFLFTRCCSFVTDLSQLSNPDVTEQDVDDVSKGLAAARIAEGDLQQLQDKQRAAVKRANGRRQPLIGLEDGGGGDASSSSPTGHPDLQDLSFGALGAEQRLVSS